MPALLIWEHDALTTVFLFANSNGRLAEIYAQRNPDKLIYPQRQLSRSDDELAVETAPEELKPQDPREATLSQGMDPSAWGASWPVGPTGAIFIACLVTNDAPSSSYGRLCAGSDALAWNI